jgi:putative pyruvate formate lyase activating enzyme
MGDDPCVWNEPSYVGLYREGKLRKRVEEAYSRLANCTLCPRECRVNRLGGERGFCGSGEDPVVASWNLHRWEEPPISGTRGSGTIFFTHCTGRCLFCQNYPISQLGVGNVITTDDLADIMLELQDRGSHNINLVTPTHFVPQIMSALLKAIPRGLYLPLVYNSSGYESEGTLRLLEGVVDIYLPDAKYADDSIARELSGFVEYVAHNHAALREMYRQVGDRLLLDEQGVALRGMIVRHMVLPEGMVGTGAVMQWISDYLSPHVYVSIMDQYFPAYKAVGHPILGRKITPEEYQTAFEALEDAGLENGWLQEHDLN